MTGGILGRYTPYNTFLHRLDARCKLFAFVVLLVAAFLPFANYSTSFVFLGFLLLLSFAFLLIGKVSILSLFKSLASLWFFIVFLLVIYVLVPSSSYVHVAFHIAQLPVYWESILEALRILLRMVVMISLSMLLTATTKPLDLTAALEWYLVPLNVTILKWIGIPSHVIAMIISLALRLIPTILEDTERIMKAQASRGVDFKHGGLKTKFRSVTSLIIPLFASSIGRSDDIADAMECRGYDPNFPRTRYRQIRFHWMDLFAFFFVSAVLAGYITASALSFDPFSFFWGLSVL